MKTDEFLNIVSDGDTGRPVIVQFGKVDPAYSGSGKPRIIFDSDLTAGGAGSASVKRYPYLGSYSPVAGHRVMLINGVIIGNIRSS